MYSIPNIKPNIYAMEYHLISRGPIEKITGFMFGKEECHFMEDL